MLLSYRFGPCGDLSRFLSLNTAPPTNFSVAHSVSAYKFLFDTQVHPDSCDFAALVLSVASLLEFCNHSKELEHQDFCSGGRDSTDFHCHYLVCAS